MATLKTVPALSWATRSASVRTGSRKSVAALPISPSESFAPEPPTQGSPMWSAASTARSLVAGLPPVEPLDGRDPVEGEEHVAPGALDRPVVGVGGDHGAPHRHHLGDDVLDRPGWRPEDLRGRRDLSRFGEEGQVVPAVRGDLHPAEGQESLRLPRLADLRESFQRVHVGERNAVEARLPGATDHVERGEGTARRVPAVDVKVDEHGVPRIPRGSRMLQRGEIDRDIDGLAWPEV
jgi:hypothetical protein